MRAGECPGGEVRNARTHGACLPQGAKATGRAAADAAASAPVAHTLPHAYRTRIARANISKARDSKRNVK